MGDDYKLHHFLAEDGGKEYVVISALSMSEVVQEFCEPGYVLALSVDIDGDATTMPCDRELRAGY